MPAAATALRPLPRLDELDEPVRRYLRHALPSGAPSGDGVRLTMHGTIDVGVRLRFTADQELSRHGLSWRARAGGRRWKPLHVVDSWAPGAGSTRGTVLGRVPFMQAAGPDTARAAAGRAAAERIWAPASLLPGAGVTWRAEAEDHIVARLDVPPETAEVHLRLAPDGTLRRISVQRWGDVGRKDFGYIPFGGDVLAERRFGDLVVPSRVSVGWWWGTPRFKPFFEATILTAEPLA